jgi:hypothetical protein
VAVMATPLAPTAIEVHWPGGKNTSALVPPNAKEISIDEGGNVLMLR